MGTPTGLVRLHPEAVPGDAQRLRWVVPLGVVPFLGPVAAMPGGLGDLVAAGMVTDVVLEPAAVLMTLADGASWRAEGARVRTALHEALARADAWVPAPGATGVAEGTDAVVARLVAEALAGAAGDYVRSHGGDVELVDVCDGAVTVRLSGACRGCSALGYTVGRHLRGELARACPLVREVTAVA